MRGIAKLAAHAKQPLMANDATKLEAALEALGIECAWISRSDMLATWTDLASGKARKGGRKYTDDQLRAVFDSIDTDGSGDIDVAELRAAMVAATTEGTAEEMLDFADVDGDRQVSFDEFKRIMLGDAAPAAPADGAEAA